MELVAKAEGTAGGTGGRRSGGRRGGSEEGRASGGRAVEADRTVVGGALLGEGEHPGIVRIGDFHVDTVPERVLLLVRHRDVPA